MTLVSSPANPAIGKSEILQLLAVYRSHAERKTWPEARQDYDELLGWVREVEGHALPENLARERSDLYHRYLARLLVRNGASPLLELSPEIRAELNAIREVDS